MGAPIKFDFLKLHKYFRTGAKISPRIWVFFLLHSVYFVGELPHLTVLNRLFSELKTEAQRKFADRYNLDQLRICSPCSNLSGLWLLGFCQGIFSEIVLTVEDIPLLPISEKSTDRTIDQSAVRDGPKVQNFEIRSELLRFFEKKSE